MSGDSKIGPVGGIVRAGPSRRVASETAAPAHTPAPAPAADTLPAAKLTRLSATLADQPPPVDVARVAALRTAIAGGNYGVHPALIASAMLDFHGRGGE
ncbi:MAG: flagellar biosynthesis anti-sigma factor FlgM [Sphingopyxis sp.]|uniref:flagellar biosynthesis anti-sigma factor FlgM n=1 Tax=Sphingopyxis sp. TaxID=1908224 RepID=UPI0032EF4D27